MTWTQAAAFSALVACGVAGPAEAGWLVTKGRTRVETRGNWQVSGDRVVFTDLQGRLVTLPLALVDLEASRLATADSVATPAPTAIPTPPPPLAEVSDSDVAHVALTGVGPPAGGDPPAVTLYSASWCGWCRKTKALLTELGVQFVERDVDRDPAARSELLKRTGGSLGVPVVDIGGTVVRGYAPDRIKSLLATPTPQPQEPSSDLE